MSAIEIPAHMSALLRDRRGLPVPYVNIWGDESVPGRWGVRYDRNVHAICTTFADDYTAAPDFTHQSPQRQRECMVIGRCQICAKHLSMPDRWLALLLDPAGDMPRGGVPDLHPRAVMIGEPWLCRDCALFAARTCPALIKRGKRRQLEVMPLNMHYPFRLVMSEGWIDGPFEHATKRQNVGMWAKLAVMPESVGLR